VKSLYVMGPREKAPEGAVVVNTTSRSNDFGQAFSPFRNQGTIYLGELKAHNVENLWQFTKVYKEHVDDFDRWCQWRDGGLSDTFAHRYPMGKGRKAEFSRLDGKELNYVEARKAIYIPAYWQKLQAFCQREVNSLVDMLSVTDVALWDFDGYLTDDGIEAIMNNPDKKMGHAFIIKKFVYKQMGRPF
jgi:hypothetical protein